MSDASPTGNYNSQSPDEYTPKYCFKMIRFLKNTYVRPYETVFGQYGEEPPSYTPRDKALLLAGKFSEFPNIPADNRDEGTHTYLALSRGFDTLHITQERSRLNDNGAFTWRDIILLPEISGTDDYARFVGSIGEIGIEQHSMIAYSEYAGSRYPEPLHDKQFVAVYVVSLWYDAYLDGDATNQQLIHESYFQILEELVQSFIRENASADAYVDYSLNTGDYIVTLFTDDVRDIIRLNASIQRPEESLFFLQTNVAMRMQFDERTGEFIQPDKISKGEKFQLRLSCSLDLIKNLQAYYANFAEGNCEISAADASYDNYDALSGVLYGYHDVLLTFTDRQFQCFQPSLSEWRLFRDADCMKNYANRECEPHCECYNEAFKGCVVKLIREGMAPRCIGTNSAEVLIDAISVELVTDIADAGKTISGISLKNPAYLSYRTYDTRKKHTEAVRKHSNSLLRRTASLRARSNKFTSYVPDITKSLGMLHDTLLSFSRIGAQYGLLLNWYNIFEFTDVVIHAIERGAVEIEAGLETFKAKEKSYKFTIYIQKCNEISRFISEITRYAVYGIGEYCKLSMSINQHDTNLGSFGMQIRVNAQKLIFAMSEFMRYIAEGYGKNTPEAHEVYRRLRAIVVPKTDVSVPTTIRLFPHAYIDNTDFDEKRAEFLSNVTKPYGLLEAEESGTVEIHPLLVFMSGFERFIEIYQTVPVLLHELAHHKHPTVTNKQSEIDEMRKSRNEIIAILAFRKISEMLLAEILDSAGIKFELFILSIYSERIIAEISGALLEEFRREMNRLGSLASKFEEAAPYLIGFISELFSSQNIEYRRTLPIKNLIDSLKKTAIRFGGSAMGCEVDRFLKQSDKILISGTFPDVGGIDEDARKKYTTNMRDLYKCEANKLVGIIMASYKRSIDKLSGDEDQASTFHIAETELNRLMSLYGDSLDSASFSALHPDLSGEVKSALPYNLDDTLIKTIRDLLGSSNNGRLSFEECAMAYAIEHELIYEKKRVKIAAKLPALVIEKVIMDFWETYNEFLSDLFMCRRLELTEQDYLNYTLFTIRKETRIPDEKGNDVQKYDTANASAFRIAMVILALNNEITLPISIHTDRLSFQSSVNIPNEVIKHCRHMKGLVDAALNAGKEVSERNKEKRSSSFYHENLIIEDILKNISRNVKNTASIKKEDNPVSDREKLETAIDFITTLYYMNRTRAAEAVNNMMMDVEPIKNSGMDGMGK